MPNSAYFRMADRLTDGHLEELLTTYIGQGLSAESISRQLYADYGIHVTGMTVRRWLADRDGQSDGQQPQPAA